MAMRLVDGDYVPDVWGGFETVSGEERLLQRIFFKLTARRGGFPLLPELGSRLHTIFREPASARKSAAEMYVREALEDENGLELQSLKLTTSEGQCSLDMTFSYSGGDLSMNMDIRAGG